MSRSALVLAVGAALLLSGCPGTDFSSCSGPTAAHAEGKCVARYYQADYGSGGQVTQALVECASLPGKPGGNVVAVRSITHGIGLKWLDPNTLEVAVPADVPSQDQRFGDTYGGYSLKYVYRQLLVGDPAFRGCGLGTLAGT